MGNADKHTQPRRGRHNCTLSRCTSPIKIFYSVRGPKCSSAKVSGYQTWLTFSETQLIPGPVHNSQQVSSHLSESSCRNRSREVSQAGYSLNKSKATKQISLIQVPKIEATLSSLWGVQLQEWKLFFFLGIASLSVFLFPFIFTFLKSEQSPILKIFPTHAQPLKIIGKNFKARFHLHRYFTQGMIFFQTHEEKGYSTPHGENSRRFSSTIHNISKEISEIIFRLTQTLAPLEVYLTLATLWSQQFPWE